jgi:hypothetical protein
MRGNGTRRAAAVLVALFIGLGAAGTAAGAALGAAGSAGGWNDHGHHRAQDPRPAPGIGR